MVTNTKVVLLLAMIVVPLFTGCAGNGWRDGKQAEVVTPVDRLANVKELPRHIVLMLPLKGELAANSQAIRNGFLAAYDYSRKDYADIDIKVVDTTSDEIQNLYNQAIADGVDVVVGPLTKREVQNILGVGTLLVPIIALNTLDDYTHNFNPQLYQFGLLPQDESTQVAIKMVAERHDRAAIIVPENSWGNKVAAAFKQRYEASGGQVAATLKYDAALNLAEQICHFLAQDPDKSCVAQQHKNKDKKENIPSELLRRQDINSIFLVATAAQARQIVPLLKFYYAGDLPIYATSAIYAGIPAVEVDQDIDGVYFCDMPWILKGFDFLSDELRVIRDKVTTIWADSFARHSRLYALGIDAYNLALGLHALLSAPHSGIDGASGVLYLDNFNHIYRELQWGQIQNGLAVALH